MKALPGRLVLLGRPVAHSLSPVFQNAALKHAGIPLTYEALDVAAADVPASLAALRDEKGAGNATIPHKNAVWAACDRLTPVAERTRAVNTFWYDGAALVGDNTDVVGFLRLVESLKRAQTPQRVALLGAGGAAAAVCAAAAAWPDAKVRVWSRQPSRAKSLADSFAAYAQAAASLDAALDGADLIVNATPVGLYDNEVIVPSDRLPRDAAVTDLVYRAGETRWVRDARASGHQAVDGLVMLVEQGAAAFYSWFGIEPDRDVMWSALRQHPLHTIK